MIAADADLGFGCSVVEGRPNTDLDTRSAGNGLNPAYDPGRPEISFKHLEARREVHDTQSLPGFGFVNSFEDRSVVEIGLMRGMEILDKNVHKARFRIVAVDQCIEDWVAIQAGTAKPAMDAMRIDQAGDCAVPDR